MSGTCGQEAEQPPKPKEVVRDEQKVTQAFRHPLLTTPWESNQMPSRKVVCLLRAEEAAIRTLKLAA